jgi:putative FmdB family regulatory protein
MPIYEYLCKACGHAFEAFIRGQETPTCPECDATDLERRFSVFGVGGSSPSESMPAPAG